jgi:hypothetical protein
MYYIYKLSIIVFTHLLLLCFIVRLILYDAYCYYKDKFCIHLGGYLEY